ncbi:sensor histidine kinase [Microbacterium sp. bgisy203]|uniref:sensor histidine kinase n=1 Tax=Microbacterium sp. bgisy203 TaxID=3413799 RepID=UPI003D70EB36
MRATLTRYARAPFWSYEPLRPVVRRVLIVIVALLLILDSLLRATSGTQTSLSRAIITTSITVAVALFVWRPPIATSVLIVAMILAAASGVARDSLLACAVAFGLVALTCSARLCAVYGIVWLAWLGVEVWRPESGLDLLPSVVISVVALISLVIGAAIRQQNDRSKMLARQLEESEREVAEQLRHERDLIADELHDIVAHEITIVALHAAVLERTEDAQTRTQSQTAIREAAVQALTDIRRVLGMVRGEENLSPERIPSPDSIDGTIAAVRRELARAGVTVTADVPEEIRLPGASLVALTRVIRESATNVLKHATGAENVRITLTVERGWAHLEFADDSPPARTAGLPSSGYGIVRLQERFRLFGGSFSAGRRAEGWVVTASLPLSS